MTPTVTNTTSVKSAGIHHCSGTAASSADIPEAVEEAVKVREVRHDHVKIEKVVFGDETKIEGTTLTIRKDGICEEAVESQELVENIELDIITPDRYDEYSNTIMDVQPIATKVEGEVGKGITRVLDGVVFMVTGTDHDGVQIGEFGSSEGEMDRNIMWGRPGSPDKGRNLHSDECHDSCACEYGTPGPLAAHRASDYICQEIREMSKADESLVTEKETLTQYRRPGRSLKSSSLRKLWDKGLCMTTC